MRFRCAIAVTAWILGFSCAGGFQPVHGQKGCTTPDPPVASAPDSVSSGWFYQVSWTATSPEDVYKIEESRVPSFAPASEFEDSGTSRYFSHSEENDTLFHYRVSAGVTCDGTVQFSSPSAPVSTLVRGTGCTDDGYEPDDQCSEARPASVGSFGSHLHCDADWLWFDAISGAKYEITTRNLTGGSDTVLELRDETCSTVLATDDDNGPEASASRIEWIADRNGPLKVGVLEFRDEYADGEGYEVEIRCLNGCGSPSEPSLYAWVERQSCHGNRPALLVRWTPVADATTYIVERLDEGYSATVDPATDGRAHLVVEGLEYGRSYDFRVVAHDGSTSTSSQTVTGYVVDQHCAAAGIVDEPPGKFIAWAEPPTCLDGTPTVEIHWSEAGGVEEYTVRRFAGSAGIGRTVSGLTDTDFVDNVDITPGVGHGYVLKAVNAAGETNAQLTLDVFPEPDLCDATGLPGELVLSAGAPFCSEGTARIPVSWTESTGAEHYSLRVLHQGQDAGGVSSSGMLRYVLSDHLEPGAVHAVFTAASDVYDETQVRYSNSAYFLVPADLCPVHVVFSSVYTLPAAGISSDSAILRTEVHPNGSATSAHIAWGETASYGNQTPELALGSSGFLRLKPSVEVSGLSCETEYHYRGVAESAAGVSTGADVSFVTGACPSCGPSHLTLSDMSVTGWEPHQACSSIKVGPNVTVQAGGDLELTAPSISFGDGVVVQDGASLRAGPSGE